MTIVWKYAKILPLFAEFASSLVTKKVTQIGTKNRTAIKTILMSVKKYIRTGNIVSFHLLIKNIL